jgi:hypothetical protein
MVYYYNPQDRARQEQEAAQNGFMTKAMSTPLAKPPSFGSQVADWAKNTAIKQGIKYGGNQLGEQVGLDDGGNYALGAYNLWNILNSNKSAADKAVGAGGVIADAAGIPGVGAVTNAYNVLGSNATDDQKATGIRRGAEDAAGAYFSAGILPAVQMLDRKFLGGKLDKLRAKTDKYNPTAIVADKIGSFAIDKLGIGGGKGQDQLRRDSVRKYLNKNGFFGDPADNKDFTLENADGTSLNLEKDGGARDANGLRMMDLDFSDKAPKIQGQAIAAVNPLAYLITGGDKNLSTDFAGYFTKTIMQGNGGADLNVANANALDKYKKAGFDTPDKAHAGIQDLINAGKIDPQMGAVFHSSIDQVFNGKPSSYRQANGQTPSTSAASSANNSTGKPRRSSGARRSSGNTYQRQEYAPQVTAPQTSAGYGNDFAQSLANIYAANQG